MITKYEIDFLAVDAADAILIHFVDDKYGERVIAIDAGKYGDGEKVANFVKDRYHRKYINWAICTHCDDDHYGGFIKIIEDYQENPQEGVRIGAFLLNDPGRYVTADDYKRYQSTPNLREEIRSVYTLKRSDKNLLEIAKNAHIRIFDALYTKLAECSLFDGTLAILGPTPGYFKALVPRMRHDAEPYEMPEVNDDDTRLVDSKCLSPRLDANKDDTSAHNQSSVIVLFKPNQEDKFVFMGDAGREAFNMMEVMPKYLIQNAFLLKVAHHGSPYNINSDIINWINPDVAIVSAENSNRYFSPLVKNALKRKGALVYSTIGGDNLWYNSGFDDREDYMLANPS